MDTTCDKWCSSEESGGTLYRLQDENASLFVDKNSLFVQPSDTFKYDQFSERLLSIGDTSINLPTGGGLSDNLEVSSVLATDPNAQYSMGNFSGSSPTLQTSDDSLSVILSDPRHPSVGSESLIYTGECLLDIRGTSPLQTETSHFAPLPDHVIDYGIIRSNEDLSLSLTQAGIDITPDQNLFLKNNSICRDPISYLPTDSPFSLDVDENGHLRADLTRVESILADTLGANILQAIDTNISLTDWGNISQGYSGSVLDTFRSQDHLVNLSNCYNETLLSGIPTEALFHTTRDFLADISFLAVSATDSEKDRAQVVQNYYEVERKYEVVELLKEVDPRFADMYQGGIDALYSGNADRVRHFSTSFRELFTHVMHRLAPDEEIKEWSSEPSLFQKGKPTRRARLKFITRELDSDEWQRYLDAETKATEEFLRLFQRGTHKIKSGYTDNQLEAITIKADATLKLFLSISSSS